MRVSRQVQQVFKVLLGILVIAIWLRGDRACAEGSPAVVMSELISLFQTDLGDISQFYDLSWSERRIQRMEELLQSWQVRLKDVPFDRLDLQGQIDALLLRDHLRSQLAALSVQRNRLAEAEPLLPARRDIQKLEETRWTMGPIDPVGGAAVVSKIPAAVKNLRERLDAGKAAKSRKEGEPKPASELVVSPVVALRSAEIVDRLRHALNTWFQFYDGFQPDFSWWLKKPHEEASKSLEDYSKYLREEIAGIKGKDEDPLIGEALGADALKRNLETEALAYSPEELIAIGEREFAWCEGEMKKASAQLGFGDDWKKALEKVKSDFVPPGEQDDLVARFGRETIQYVKENQLVTVPPLCEETWRLTMISPETQKSLPFAAYGGQNMMVAYAKEEMKHEDKMMSMRGNNRHFTRIVTAHELIPGHHLQKFTAARVRPYRSIFSTPFLVEGWALYWEMTLWDRGYAKTPEDQIGMLFWRMHRCARIIVSLKFHLNQMTPSEMVTFLVDRVGHERFGATSEVRRFIGGAYSPLYQCGYMIGGLQLRALYAEQVGSGKMTPRQFNDTVLSYNAIPIEWIRAGMSQARLAPDSKPAWRFTEVAPVSGQK